MKFLHVISTLDPRNGGPGQGVRNIAARLSQEENTSAEIVCLDDPNSDYLSREKIRIHAARARTLGLPPRLAPLAPGQRPKF